jgi:hypothetical protein
MVKPATPESHEERCPACGVAFRLADRRKRVQCPHCMEIVELAPDKPAGRSATTAGTKEISEIKSRLARVEQLETRIAALERELAELRAAAPAVAASAQEPVAKASPPAAKAKAPPEPAPKPIWHESRLSEIAAAADEMPAAQHETLVANLAALGSRRIVIQATSGDGSAALRASRFREIFGQANWTVPAVIEASDRLGRRPLALVSRSGSAPREMAELFMALTASGFKPVSLIDPALDGGDPILCVGPQPEDDNGSQSR